MNESIQVTLLKAHRHTGREYAVDDVIEVTPADAAWLAAHDVIAPLDGESKTTQRGRRRDRED